MKLTKREKIMLSILGILAIFAVSYFFLFKPKIDEITLLINEAATYSAKIQQIKNELTDANGIDNEYAKLDKSTAEKTVAFYPVILQDKLIVVVNDIINRTSIKSNSISFSDITIRTVRSGTDEEEVVFPAKQLVDQYFGISSPVKGKNLTDKAKTAEINEKSQDGSQEPVDLVGCISVKIEYGGNYKQITDFINAVENLKRNVLLSDMEMEMDQNGLLKGTLILDFYSLPKIHEQDQEYFKWTFNGSYGTDNPFRPFPGYTDPSNKVDSQPDAGIIK